ncbi:uncharacterized protein HaLaN_04590 [Haematococcus lacustris]|uniref:Uncharacterized protein n=1 Tax=Haematococcus lacustris TaxID=44745 RepID=A0A699YSY7_HAELA|nr:uncharacterized protein HaLaN_04590 [Haematococcus lacustris]
MRNLESLELSECAVRGDSLQPLLGAIRKHKALTKVKVVQTGILKKYRNTKTSALGALFKPKLGLTHVAVSGAFWGETLMQAAADQLKTHTTLQSLAIEFPVSISLNPDC